MSELNIYLIIAVAAFLLASLRYLVMTGIYYVVVYRIFKKYWAQFKIQKKDPSAIGVRKEIYWGVLNNINFSLLGMIVYYGYNHSMLSVFNDFYEYSWVYHISLVFILLLLHDTYFFWIHWLMHKTKLGKWLRHDVHHQPENVSPWSAFSVHPFEGFVEVAFRLFTLTFVPMHLYDFIFFEILTFALNIIGHSGYEFFPQSFAKGTFTKFKSCATFHYLHHHNGKTNLSLFFNHWDRWMGTLNTDYESFYERVMRERKS